MVVSGMILNSLSNCLHLKILMLVYVLNERNYASKENYSISDDEEHCKLHRNICPLHLQIVSKLPLSRGHVQFSFTIYNCRERGEYFLGFDVLKNPLYLPSFF
jgi:hypothetical protein